MRRRVPSEAAITAEMERNGVTRGVAIRRIQDRAIIFSDIAENRAGRLSRWRA